MPALIYGGCIRGPVSERKEYKSKTTNSAGVATGGGARRNGVLGVSARAVAGADVDEGLDKETRQRECFTMRMAWIKSAYLENVANECGAKDLYSCLGRRVRSEEN